MPEPEQTPPGAAPADPPAEPSSQYPSPPPFRPDTDLIGYIEKGQKPVPPAAPPNEKR